MFALSDNATPESFRDECPGHPRRATPVVGVSVFLLYCLLNVWISSIIFAYIRRKRQVVVHVDTVESLRLPGLN